MASPIVTSVTVTLTLQIEEQWAPKFRELAGATCPVLIANPESLVVFGLILDRMRQQAAA